MTVIRLLGLITSRFRIERHRLGPRFFVLGKRVHECHAGAVLLAACLAAVLTDVPVPKPVLALMLVPATWMLVKDWQDFIPSRRDTLAWSASMHRRPRPLREARTAAWLPPLAGLLAVIVGAVNVASTLTPDFSWRARLIRHALPDTVPLLAHAIAFPAGIALVVIGFYLARRRRRAWIVGVAILIAVGALNLLKGLDVEEAAASWALAGLLFWGRPAFLVQHDRSDWPTALRRVALVLLAAAATVGLGLLEPLEWMPLAIGLVAPGAMLACVYVLFRPLATPRGVHQPGLRRRARRLVELHGRDTLSFFKLRTDHLYFFSRDERAFLAYQIEGGVLLLSGDPVGPDDALPGLMREICAFAEVRGLKVGAVGASEDFAALATDAGLKSFYIGDEALVDTDSFSLEGRAIRKLRQSVSRLEKAGYVTELAGVGSLDRKKLNELERISERWLAGDSERGFSMAMDSLRGEHLAGSVAVIARDSSGSARAFVHFVPAYGRSAMSLSIMRRDRDTPNGLMEFLVVRAITLLRERGVRELSLNFAAFARLLHSPTSRRDRLLGRLITVGNRYFQTESLYRFNSKFIPRWEQRYLLYEGPLGLPRAGLAAMWAEGQLPKPRLGRAQQPQAA
jgi:lysyl-tRNA synthetase class 2